MFYFDRRRQTYDAADRGMTYQWWGYDIGNEVLVKIHENLYPEKDDTRIAVGFKRRMGDDVKVTVNHVDSISRDASGKYRYVVSKVGAFDKG